MTAQRLERLQRTLGALIILVALATTLPAVVFEHVCVPDAGVGLVCTVKP